MSLREALSEAPAGSAPATLRCCGREEGAAELLGAGAWERLRRLGDRGLGEGGGGRGEDEGG